LVLSDDKKRFNPNGEFKTFSVSYNLKMNSQKIKLKYLSLSSYYSTMYYYNHEKNGFFTNINHVNDKFSFNNNTIEEWENWIETYNEGNNKQIKIYKNGILIFTSQNYNKFDTNLKFSMVIFTILIYYIGMLL
jgi:hypothetical protein